MSDQQKFWNIGKLAGIFLIVFLGVISIKELKSIAYVGKDVPIMNTITVNGKGEAISIPDIATFSFSVTETAATVEAAQTAATAKINSAIKALKDNGVEDKDIKTTSYNINPHYEYVEGNCPLSTGPVPPCQGKNTLTGYDVSQTIEVKVRDLKKAGMLFATIGGLDVQNVNGLTFSIDDIEGVKAQARSLAIEDAKSKAKTLAGQLGVTLVGVTNFSDQSEQPIPYATDAMPMGVMMKSAAAIPPQIPAGEQKVTSNVSITYEIR